MSEIPVHLTLAYNIERSIRWLLASGVKVDTGHWQGVSTEGKPDMVTTELSPLILSAYIPHTVGELAEQTKANLPWAEDHFQERVSRVPSNPGEQYKNWPWWRGQDDQALTEGRGPTDPKFTHTYQERFWPKQANRKFADPWRYAEAARGIRYRYGDLDDVVHLLRREPYTRQAYLPIFFPEDTGAVHGGRIPCSLGYHFLLRENTLTHKLELNVFYDIRSCDAVRHFRDDVYLSCRLVQWVLEELTGTTEGPDGPDPLWVNITLGTLLFKANSFHVHAGDRHLL